MDLATVTSKADDALQPGGDFDKKVKFDFGDDGKLFLDGVNGKASNEDADADAVITVDWDDFQKLLAGQLDPTMAFMQGKLKVAGDMSVAMKLQSVLSKLT